MNKISAKERIMANRTGPTWLKPLLEGSFFDHCAEHITKNKNERNFFCLSCVEGPLCHLCIHESHLEHKKIQIFRSSYCEAVRTEDISDAVNLSGMQKYKINQKSIVFLNARPQAKQQKGVSHACEACDRMLIDPVRFCSLGCKMQVAIADPRVTLSSGHTEHHSGAKSDLDAFDTPARFDKKALYGDVKNLDRTSSMESSRSRKRERDYSSGPEAPSTPEMKKAHRRKGVPRPSPAIGEFSGLADGVFMD